MHLLRFMFVVTVATLPIGPSAAQQYIPNIAAQNSCSVDQRLVRQAFVSALANVRRRKMSEDDFKKHISGCDRLDLIYYRRVAAL